MHERARAVCKRCLRVFLDLMEGEAPTELHRSVKALVEKSPKCRACFASYKKTVTLCKKSLGQGRPSARREELLAALRDKLNPPR